MLTWDEQDRVLHAVMRRAPVKSPVPELVDRLAALVDDFDSSSAKVLVLSSAVPDWFAGGLDLHHVGALTVEEFADYRDAARAPLERLAQCKRPSIAALGGRALGLGLEVAMACTLRFAAPSARVAFPQVMLGLIPGGGGTQRLPHLVGRGRALELLLTAREIDGEEAWRIGLVDRVLSRDVVEETLDIAARMARASGPAMTAIIQCVDAARDLPHDRGLAVESVALLSAFEEGEAREGIAALLEQRPPAFA